MGMTVFVVMLVLIAHPALDVLEPRTCAAQRDVNQKCKFDLTVDRTLKRQFAVRIKCSACAARANNDE